MNDEPGCAQIVAALFLAPLLALYGWWADGFALAKLWAWHVAPRLHVAAIDWRVFAIASIAMSLGRAKATGQVDDRPEWERSASLLMTFALPWLGIFCGWCWL